MTTDAGLSHEQAHAFLHTGRRQLSGSEAKQLDAHLAACAECRAYAAYLPAAEPQLAAALHTRWDAAQPALSERAFTEQVRARSGRARPTARSAWLPAVPLAAAVVVLVLAVLWIGSGWGFSGPVQQPTEVALTAPPLPTGILLGPIPQVETPTPTTPALPAEFYGRWVAFLVRDAAGHDELHAMRTRLNAPDEPDSVGLAHFLYPPNHDSDLTWSPDGTQLAFVSDRTGHLEVFVAQAGPWTVKQLTLSSDASDSVDYGLAWSADGSSILLTRRLLGPNMYQSGEIYMIDPNATLVRFPAEAQRIQGEVTGDPMWSPDGRWTVYSGLNAQGQPAIFACEPTCPGRQLTPATDPASGAYDVYLGLTWSPDSRQVAYLRQGPWVGGLNDAQPGEGFHSSIELVSLVAEPSTPPTTLLDLAPSPNGIMGLSWSPDGQYLLYLSDAVTAGSLGGSTASSGCWTPRLLPTTTGAPIQVAGPVVALSGFCYLTRTALPEWSADGRYLLLSTEAGLALIDVPAAVADPDQVQPIYLTNLPAGRPHSPTWQP